MKVMLCVPVPGARTPGENARAGVRSAARVVPSRADRGHGSINLNFSPRSSPRAAARPLRARGPDAEREGRHLRGPGPRGRGDGDSRRRRIHGRDPGGRLRPPERDPCGEGAQDGPGLRLPRGNQEGDGHGLRVLRGHGRRRAARPLPRPRDGGLRRGDRRGPGDRLQVRARRGPGRPRGPGEEDHQQGREPALPPELRRGRQGRHIRVQGLQQEGGAAPPGAPAAQRGVRRPG